MKFDRCAQAPCIYRNLVFYYIDFGLSKRFEAKEHPELGHIGLMTSWSKGTYGYRMLDIIKLPRELQKKYTRSYKHSGSYVCSVMVDRCALALTIMELMMGRTFLYISRHHHEEQTKLCDMFPYNTKYNSLPEWMTQHDEKDCFYNPSTHQLFCSKLMARFPYDRSGPSIWNVLYALCDHGNIFEGLDFFLDKLPHYN